MDTDRTPKDSRQPGSTSSKAPESDRKRQRYVSLSSSVSESQSHTSEIRLGFRPCPHSLLDVLSTAETDFTPSQGIHVQPRQAFAIPLRQDSTVPPRETLAPFRQETSKIPVRQMSFVHRFPKPDIQEQAKPTTPSSMKLSTVHFDTRGVLDQQIDRHHRFPADWYQSGVTHPVQSGYTPFCRSPSLLEQYAPQALRCYGQRVYAPLTYQYQQQQDQLHREQLYSWQAYYDARDRASVAEECHYQYHHDPSHVFADQIGARRTSYSSDDRHQGSVTPVQLALGSKIDASSSTFSVRTGDNGGDHDSADATDETPKHCENCGARKTLSWRRCTQTGKLLCTACGLYQKYHGMGRPPKTRQGRQQLSQQQEATTGPMTTSFGIAQYQPYPSPSKTLKDAKTEEEEKVGPMKKMCKICGVKTSSMWHPALGEVSGVICDSCSLQAKLLKVAEKVQQRIGLLE